MRFFVGTTFVALSLTAWAWSGAEGPFHLGSGWEPADPAVRDRLVRHADKLWNLASSQVASFSGTPPPPSLRASLFRLLALAQAGWVLLLAAGAAIFVGLYVRESARDALRFSSPTWNYLGKRLAGLAFPAMVTLPLFPIPVDAWVPYGIGFAFDVGVALYVANLPIKL